MKEYNHKKIEKKWQKFWETKKIYQAVDFSKKKKFYSLIEFPYPSAAGLHVGHIKSNTAMDIISRKRRMEGYNVLYPIGWDAFGLPTENFAIKTGKKPALVTKKNTGVFRKQLKEAGFSFDWSREIDTTDPKYYKWTQWIFLQLFKKGLAYKAKSYINWCPSCKIGLANEEAIGGVCERCGSQTEKKEKEQWMLAITKYADRLDKDLDLVEYPERVKTQQRNWIGKSEGSEIEFKIKITSPDASAQVLGFPSPSARPDRSHKHTGSANSIKVFTTRIDTIFGATYVVLAPEHELIEKIKSRITNLKEVEKYIKEVKNKTELERTSEDKDTSTGSVQAKTGVELKGVMAINPATGEEIPIWIADYVLSQYGTGAVMAVPAHDERDFEFAKKYKLPTRQVVAPYWIDPVYKPLKDKETERREVVTIILRNKKEKKVLCLKWNSTSWQSFPTGGTDGEDLEEAARREILEETGYKNLKFITQVPGSTFVEFWRPHKGSNVYAHFYYLVFDLIDEEKENVDASEIKNHTPVWVPEKEVLSFLNVENQKFMWSRFCNGDSVFVDYGILTNSGKYSGLTSKEAIKEITKEIGGKTVTKFKLRDWVFSRQRYWGEPIPLIYCPSCAEASKGKENAGWQAVPEKDLPVKLPEVKSYKPTDTGESPLSAISKWVNVKCPKCKGPAKRETDTMPNWAGSSWYYLRYIDPKNNKVFADQKKLVYWSEKGKAGPVDWYNGGMEHTTLHLLYSRFWHKFLYDLKLVSTLEPYKKRTSHGMILGEGGVKMSKSVGNVVNPDDIIKTYGADTLRIYEMFMGPFEEAVAWSTESIIGSRRFIEKVWRVKAKLSNDFSRSGRASISAGKSLGEENRGPEKLFESEAQISLKKLLHKTIKKVSEDIEAMRFNTAISAMMILVSEMESAYAKGSGVTKDDFKKFLQILAPFAPHVAEELWFSLGEKKSIHLSDWPKWDEKLAEDQEIKIAVQVNGKTRSEVLIEKDETEESVKNKVLADPKVQKYLNGEIKRVIYVKNRVINIIG